MPDRRGELPRRQPTPQFGVDGATLLNENRTVAVSLRRELQKQRPSAGRFPFRDASFANQRLNGAMDDSAVQSEQRGDLVLVQRGAPAQRREDRPKPKDRIRAKAGAAGTSGTGPGLLRLGVEGSPPQALPDP